MRRPTLALLLCAVALSGCGGTEDTGGTSAPAPSRSSSSAPPSSTSSPTPAPATTATRTPAPRPTAARRVRGVDVSHHQGTIDWPRVRRAGLGFAYLKATEGSTFTDPRFVTNAREADAAGLRVGGYHYFSLCSPGAAQGDHFAEVLAAAPAGSLPPAIDLELLGNCAEPPARAVLLAEVRAFLDVVERRTGQRVVVYAYPDFESRFDLAEALGRRLWVRRIGDTPPTGDWWLWQRDDRARIDGIDGPADLDVLAP